MKKSCSVVKKPVSVVGKSHSLQKSGSVKKLAGVVKKLFGIGKKSSSAVKILAPLVRLSPRAASASTRQFSSLGSPSPSPWQIRFENVVGVPFLVWKSGYWSAPSFCGDGISNTDGTTHSYTRVTVWNPPPSYLGFTINNSCNTVSYDDAYTQSTSSDAGRIYLWFKAPPGNYTVKIGWALTLEASGSLGTSGCSMTDVINHVVIEHPFIQTSDSPWSETGIYDLNVTTTDNLEHEIFFYTPTLNFNPYVTEHVYTGTAAGNFTIISVNQN